MSDKPLTIKEGSNVRFGEFVVNLTIQRGKIVVEFVEKPVHLAYGVENNLEKQQKPV